MTRTGLKTALLAAALAALLTFPPLASAAGLPLGGGETRLAIDRGLKKALQREGVAIRPIGPAKSKGQAVILPVAGGTFDEGAGKAVVTDLGGLRFVAKGKVVAVRKLQLNTAARSLVATVAGRRLRLANLAGTKLEDDGFDARLHVRRLPLTRAGATALRRVAPDVLRAGRSLGSVNGVGEVSEVQIDFGTISMGGPGTAFSKLESIEAQMGIWGGTETWNAPGERYFLFPVKPTTITRDAAAGVLEGAENDGVTMEIHEPPPRQMLLRHPSIDLAAHELSATLSPISTESPLRGVIATLDYSAAQFQVRAKVGIVELMGIQAVANQLIADQLNERFATPGLFQAGEVFARITVTLHDV